MRERSQTTFQIHQSVEPCRGFRFMFFFPNSARVVVIIKYI